jgi:hypothetical protein
MQGMDACGRWGDDQAAVVHGWLRLPVCYGSLGLSIALPYIYTHKLCQQPISTIKHQFAHALLEL